MLTISIVRYTTWRGGLGRVAGGVTVNDFYLAVEVKLTPDHRNAGLQFRSRPVNAHGQALSYRLELHNPGTVTHREYLVITRGGKDQRIRLPLFDEGRSGYVSPKTPSDWIVLHPTEDADIYHAETGRFLFVRKSFRVNLRTGEVTTLASKSGSVT